jgi:hypothetical protein
MLAGQPTGNAGHREQGRGVYAQSQLTIAEFAWRVHCGKEGHRFVAALQFKFDEIFDNRSMTLAGWLAEESEWRRLESQLQRCIDKKNAKHNPDKQITRFQNYPDFPGEPEG